MTSNLILGESLGFWLQTVAIIVSAMAAVFAVYHNGVMAKRRATIDVILEENNNVSLQEAKYCIFTQYKDKNLINLYYDHENSDRKVLITVLNRYEFISQGIRSGAFDEKIYKAMQYSSLVKIWSLSCPLIMDIRRTQQSATIYQEIEWLGKRWLKKPLKQIKC